MADEEPAVRGSEGERGLDELRSRIEAISARTTRATGIQRKQVSAKVAFQAVTGVK